MNALPSFLKVSTCHLLILRFFKDLQYKVAHLKLVETVLESCDTKMMKMSDFTTSWVQASKDKQHLAKHLAFIC